MTLLTNGIVTPFRDSLRTWGELVEVVDQRLSATQHVVTAVRIGGVDEPAFRDPAVCARPLADIDSIEVETGEPRALARQCLQEAAAAMAGLSQATRDAADGFRYDRVAPARHGLEQVCQGLLAVLQIVAATGLALRRELDVVDASGRSISTLSVDLDRVIRDLTEGQQNEDWLLVADILEYDLDPMLTGWHSVLTHVVAA